MQVQPPSERRDAGSSRETATGAADPEALRSRAILLCVIGLVAYAIIPNATLMIVFASWTAREPNDAGLIWAVGAGVLHYCGLVPLGFGLAKFAELQGRRRAWGWLILLALPMEMVFGALYTSVVMIPAVSQAIPQPGREGFMLLRENEMFCVLNILVGAVGFLVPLSIVSKPRAR